jgi:hypothetical protein
VPSGQWAGAVGVYAAGRRVTSVAADRAEKYRKVVSELARPTRLPLAELRWSAAPAADRVAVTRANSVWRSSAPATAYRLKGVNPYDADLAGAGHDRRPSRSSRHDRSMSLQTTMAPDSGDRPQQLLRRTVSQDDSLIGAWCLHWTGVRVNKRMCAPIGDGGGNPRIRYRRRLSGAHEFLTEQVSPRGKPPVALDAERTEAIVSGRPRLNGRSAMIWERGVAGSNPVTPTRPPTRPAAAPQRSPRS